jgi:cysteine desulfurase
LIYLDHNATTPLHPQAFEAMVPYLRERWGNPSSPYRFGTEARVAVERARTRIAECVGCKPAELVFCSSGTESDNLALRGVAQALKSKGNHIVTTGIEHPAVLNTCKALEREGYRITYLPVNRDGVVEIEALAASLGAQTILVTVMHANNETGVVQPVEEIAAITRKRGIVFHTDAVQSAGKLPQRLGELGADLITFSGHKLYGPKGVAALYVRDGTPLAPVTTGGAHEHGLRAGTENVAGIVGFAEAVTLAFESSETEGQRLRALRDRLEREVSSAIRRVKLNGARAPRVPNTSNMSFQGVDGESIVLGLDVRGICVSTGSACSTGDPEPSHVLLAIGLSPREAQGSIRLSMGRETREEDIGLTVQTLVETVERLRRVSSVRDEAD